MPKNDLQQNSSSLSKEETHDRIVRNLYIVRHAFGMVAEKYGGEVRYANQYPMIWAGMGSDFSTSSWKGVCKGLAIEWIKEHMMGNDLLAKVIQVRNLLLSGMKCDNESARFVNRLQIERGIEFRKYLSKFGVFDGYGKYYYPFSKSHEAFEPCHYQIILTTSHVMASCVYEDKKMDFYDPDAGEAKGLSSARFVGDYMMKTYDMGSKYINPLLKKFRKRIYVNGLAPVRRRHLLVKSKPIFKGAGFS